MNNSTQISSNEVYKLKKSWIGFIRDFPTGHELFAVTLAFNNRIQGTVLPCTSLGARTSGVIHSSNGRSAHILGGYRPIAVTEITPHVNHLWLKANAKLWGPRYVRARKPVCSYRGFIENADANVHVHLAWAVPPTAPRHPLSEVLQSLWLERVPSGSTSILPMTDAEGWGSYLIKKVFTRDWSDRSGTTPRPEDSAENFLSSLPSF